ncbi:hypothetical protein THAOC_28868, partial [Thalassiosira oceanica]
MAGTNPGKPLRPRRLTGHSSDFFICQEFHVPRVGLRAHNELNRAWWAYRGPTRRQEPRPEQGHVRELPYPVRRRPEREPEQLELLLRRGRRGLRGPAGRRRRLRQLSWARRPMGRAGKRAGSLPRGHGLGVRVRPVQAAGGPRLGRLLRAQAAAPPAEHEGELDREQVHARQEGGGRYDGAEPEDDLDMDEAMYDKL